MTAQESKRKREELKEYLTYLRWMFSLTEEERKKEFKIFRAATIKACEEYIEALETIRATEMLIGKLNISKNKIDILLEDLRHQLDIASKSRTSTHSAIKPFVELVLIQMFRSGRTHTEAIQILYDLFVRFEYQDYGKGGEDDIRVEGEITKAEEDQKERIRKTFVEPLIKEAKET